MIDRNMRRTTLVLAAAAVVSLAAVGCGGGPTFTAEQASALILAQFPDSDLQIRTVSIDEEGRGVAFSRFNDEVWTFYFQPLEDNWVLDAVETGGSFYYLKDLEQISVTISLMAEAASALERYKAANGAYPEGESADALSALVPDFTDAEALFTDAWDGALSYESDGDDYTMISNGADKTAGTRDDVILHDGEFVGSESSGGQGSTPSS